MTLADQLTKVSYIMFHYVTGTPFESNAGAYDGLTLWEQIDDGAHFTPTKKWLTSLPILLYDPPLSKSASENTLTRFGQLSDCNALHTLQSVDVFDQLHCDASRRRSQVPRA